MPPPLDLGHLRFADTVELGQAVRSLGAGLHSQQEAAQRLVEYLYASFRDAATGEPHTGLVRCFKTQPLGSLPPAQRAAAAASLPEQDLPETPALPDSAGHARRTRGVEPAQHLRWPQGHTLPDTAMVERAPMIAALFSQMGVDIDVLVAPPRENFVLEQGTSSYNVFHVEDARGSALIPAQQTFVIPHGIRSVVGMGGRMPIGRAVCQ